MFSPQKQLGMAEFVSLLAFMISILALSIDAMLPALDQMGRELGLTNPNDAQLVVSAMFLGFAAGQLVAGPLSDCYGRKPVIYLGYVIFIAGCLMSMVTESFEVMLAGRVLQGLGAAAPRIVGIALVRDGYEGRAMARIMSIVMAIFILVPAIAPAIGQVILLFAHWRAIFAFLLVVALVAFAWFAMRQPETLEPAGRRQLIASNLVDGIREALGYRALMGYTVASGIIFGAFLGYLSSAQQIFQTTYETGQWFAAYFGVAALAIGAASVFNSRVVERLGMRFMTWRAMFGIAVTAWLFLAVVLVADGTPPLWLFMAWLFVTLFCLGVLFGNFNALAMEPVGHMAGLGAAIVGSVSTFIALPLGWAVGAGFDGTVLPLVLGFAVLGIAALGVMAWTERMA